MIGFRGPTLDQSKIPRSYRRLSPSSSWARCIGASRSNLRGFDDERFSRVLLSQINDFAHAHRLVLSDRVRDVHVLRIRGLALHGGLYVDVEIAAIQISRGDAIAIVGQLARRKRLSGVQLKSFGSGELFENDVLVSRDCDVLDDRLRAFGNFEITPQSCRRARPCERWRLTSS